MTGKDGGSHILGVCQSVNFDLGLAGDEVLFLVYWSGSRL
jgi:hypothetical protein